VKPTYNLTISIDDNHPETGWGVEGDRQMEMLDSLNKEFGAKFTLFIPSNYHMNYPISQHKGWIDWLNSKGYFELAAHGHFHETPDRKLYGECEFAFLQNVGDVRDRIAVMNSEWQKVNHIPKGWRNPGWLCSHQSYEQLKHNFHWAAVHYEHNHGLDWNPCKMVFGADGINEGELNQHGNNNIMFQSHIAGDWNKNVWNEENYDNIRNWLVTLTTECDIQFKTISELVL
jgi:hypothetical protein